jgi:hypothetical protein
LPHATREFPIIRPSFESLPFRSDHSTIPICCLRVCCCGGEIPITEESAMKPSPHADLWGSPPPQIVDSVPAAFASTSQSSAVMSRTRACKATRSQVPLCPTDHRFLYLHPPLTQADKRQQRAFHRCRLLALGNHRNRCGGITDRRWPRRLRAPIPRAPSLPCPGGTHSLCSSRFMSPSSK